METCEYCKWYYKEHCVNGLSEEVTEPKSKDDSCKWFELDNGEGE